MVAAVPMTPRIGDILFIVQFCGAVDWAAQRLNVQPRGARELFCDLETRRARLGGCNVVLGSPPCVRTARVVFSIPRRAAFTASPVGNATATSGSRTTMLFSRRSRSTYLPRTPPFIEAKSYCARMSSSGWSAFFIKSSFLWRRISGIDYSNSVLIFGMRHNQNLLVCRNTNGHKTLFIFRVIVARIGSRERVRKDRCGFFEIDAMFVLVGDGFARIPRDQHCVSIRSTLFERACLTACR